MNKQEEKAEKKSKLDLPLKILSVIMAIFIWFWIIGLETQVTRKNFASILVHAVNVNDMKSKYGFSMLDDREIYIDVILEGKSVDLNKLKASDIYAYIDLSNVAQAGEISLPIEIREMDNVSVFYQSQSSMLQYIDVASSRNIPVNAKIVQMVTSSDFDIGELVKRPDTIAVYGPKGILDTLDHALVNISLGSETINRSTKVTEKFILVNKEGEEVKNQYVTTKEITAIDIEIPVTMTKEVPLALNYKHDYYNSKNAAVTITPEKIEIKGPPDEIARIESIGLKEQIDEKKYEADTTITSPIVLPEGIESLSGETAQIEIKFIDPETKYITVSTRQNSNFMVTGPKGAEYHIKEDSIKIKILGPRESVQKTNSSGISVRLDLSAYEKGTHSEVPLDILSLDDSVFCVGEYTISVEIY
ncbi:MAG: hypothetical protein FWH48_09090 [Oscillospiraceae bacterium]|nr:hypothetical protein [Oscillospiraceae bacterium]